MGVGRVLKISPPRFLGYDDNGMERTFCMIKPDGVRRGLTGDILVRLEKKGYRPVGLKRMRISPELALRHYAEHQGKPFYNNLVRFITSGPVVAMALEGEGAIPGLRRMMGATDPADSTPGTIRGDFATTIEENVIHGSASPGDAERELGLFFSPGELV